MDDRASRLSPINDNDDVRMKKKRQRGRLALFIFVLLPTAGALGLTNFVDSAIRKAMKQLFPPEYQVDAVDRDRSVVHLQ